MQDPTLLDNNSKQKTQPLDYQMIAFALRGLERIRTAVGAFAEPSLATRPRRHCFNGLQIYIKSLKKGYGV